MDAAAPVSQSCRTFDATSERRESRCRKHPKEIQALLAAAVLYLSMSLDGFIAGPSERDLHGGLVGAVVRDHSSP